MDDFRLKTESGNGDILKAISAEELPRACGVWIDPQGHAYYMERKELHGYNPHDVIAETLIDLEFMDETKDLWRDVFPGHDESILGEDPQIILQCWGWVKIYNDDYRAELPGDKMSMTSAQASFVRAFTDRFTQIKPEICDYNYNLCDQMPVAQVSQVETAVEIATASPAVSMETIRRARQHTGNNMRYPGD